MTHEISRTLTQSMPIQRATLYADQRLPPIELAPTLPRIGDRYKDFGCTVNTISVEDLFTRYESSGFLYPAKRQRLMPHMAILPMVGGAS